MHQKIEYKIVECSFTKDQLNSLGLEGWQLASTYPHTFMRAIGQVGYCKTLAETITGLRDDHNKYLDEIARVLHPNANEGFAYVPGQLAEMVRKLVEEAKLESNLKNEITNYLNVVITERDRAIRERDNLIAAIRLLQLPTDH